jgi:aryl-alcohol dehydrogenase-like predicted oxidoreductase
MSAEPAESTTLPRVPLGRNGLEVTRLCLGAAQLGELRSEETGQAMLEAAWAGGIRSFDVAPLYGCGLAERRLGAFLAAKPRDSFVLSTKVGRLLVPKGGAPDPSLPSENNLQPVFDYSRDGVHASLEASLERLGLDRVDITLIHDPDDHFVEAMHDAYPALEELRSAGVVRAIGLGMNQAEMLTRFVSDTDVDCVLVAGRYSLLDNRASRALLPAAAERGIAVLVAGVFNGGILTDPHPGTAYDYRPAAPELAARVPALREIADAHDVPLARAALHFPLRNPAVTAIVVGTRSPEEVAENLANFSSPLSDAFWADLEASGLLGWPDPFPAVGDES